jgi:hypothetical protein
MLSNKISLIVDSVCRQHGIDYCSLNPHLQTFVEDAARLGEIYQNLKIIMGDLKDIEERHDIKELNKQIESIIKILDSVDHDIIHLAREFKEKDSNA